MISKGHTIGSYVTHHFLVQIVRQEVHLESNSDWCDAWTDTFDSSNYGPLAVKTKSCRDAGIESAMDCVHGRENGGPRPQALSWH